MSYDTVIGVLRTTNVNKKCGPDNISGVILRECAKELAGPLTVLLDMSLNCGTSPTCFKCATVIPVYKKGDKRNVCNYLVKFLRKWCMTHYITMCVTQFRALARICEVLKHSI